MIWRTPLDALIDVALAATLCTLLGVPPSLSPTPEPSLGPISYLPRCCPALAGKALVCVQSDVAVTVEVAP